MTIQLKRRFCGLITSLCAFTCSYAQVSEFQNLKPVDACREVKVYQNIKDEFDMQFSGAEDVKWSLVNKNFLANFSMSDRKYAVLFNPRAVMIYKIVYGKEKDLPTDIRRWVKRVYLEWNIASAVKVEEAGRNIWLINVVDSTEFAWVTVENDEIKEVEKYKKYLPDTARHPSLAKK